MDRITYLIFELVKKPCLSIGRFSLTITQSKRKRTSLFLFNRCDHKKNCLMHYPFGRLSVPLIIDRQAKTVAGNFLPKLFLYCCAGQLFDLLCSFF
ncbi:hypothetical protein [Estrella lausannensis]|uniref:hypothetical protein n=1 Tax=Estrella lausannensis TaxID=483423 RepID=UPI000BEFBF13|nr:hypothetical protein [Estrella lausannensis]